MCDDGREATCHVRNSTITGLHSVGLTMAECERAVRRDEQAGGMGQGGPRQWPESASGEDAEVAAWSERRTRGRVSASAAPPAGVRASFGWCWKNRMTSRSWRVMPAACEAEAVRPTNRNATRRGTTRCIHLNLS